MDTDATRVPADLPKDEAGRPERAPENPQPDVTEATVSVPDELTIAITVSEAGQRNACNVRARLADLDEVETCWQGIRRALPNEAGKITVLLSKTAKRFSAA